MEFCQSEQVGTLIHSNRNMPNIDDLMQEWPENFEELLKEVGLPTADLDCDLATYVDMICGKLVHIFRSIFLPN